MNDTQAIELFDSTLRDGTQGEGVNLSVEDKLHIAKRLDEFGISIIEGGWPGSNPRDQEFFERSKQLKLKQAKICAFGSTARDLNNVETDNNLQALLKADTEVVSIFGKTWRLHAEKGLGLSADENAELIERSVAFLAAEGRRVIFDAEHFFDGYKDSPSFAMQMIKAAEAGGAETIALCDTNGGAMPDEVAAAVKTVMAEINIPIGIHAHNDSGMAAANSIIAVQNGATQVQGTMNGVGERCGNANLSTVIPNLVLKLGRELKQAVDLSQMTPMANYVFEIMNLNPDDRAPFVGRSAFAHKGGIHVSAVMKDSRMYEHIDPATVGSHQRVLISDLSGQSNIRYKAEELDISMADGDKRLPGDVVRHIKKMEHSGYQFEAAEASFELILRQQMGTFTPFFEVVDSRVIVSYERDSHNRADAMLKVAVNGDIEHTAADGVGPVNALNKALQKALVRFYPELQDVHLTDYKVRVLNGRDGTSAGVRVLVESSDRNESWSTVGVSENIIEASWQALVDSLNYKLMKSNITNLHSQKEGE
jgi:2-isopropylmalate synthase